MENSSDVTHAAIMAIDELFIDAILNSSLLNSYWKSFNFRFKDYRIINNGLLVVILIGNNTIIFKCKQFVLSNRTSQWINDCFQIKSIKYSPSFAYKKPSSSSRHHRHTKVTAYCVDDPSPSHTCTHALRWLFL